MSISFFDPLSRAWGRMIEALFKPFDIGKWFAVGFTAFLAELTEGPHGSMFNDSEDYNGECWRDIFEGPRIAWEWLTDNPGWFMLIIFGLVVLIGFIILLTWLSSRGKFMLLDNVVHNKSQISKPWKEYAKQADSLFIWRFCFGLLCFFIVVIMLSVFGNTMYNFYQNDFESPALVISIVIMALTFIALVLVISFISMALNDFVVPIMYKHKLSAVQGWNRFFPILGKHLLYFLIYGVIILVFTIIVVIGVMIFGFMTCCIGFVLLVIPYIGSVVTLPITYVYRGYSIEFLAQFGSEFNVFPAKKVKK